MKGSELALIFAVMLEGNDVSAWQNWLSIGRGRTKLSTSNDNPSAVGQKRIVFIRHGCTFMNEYLAECGYGSQNFTDVFSEDKKHQYHDTPLSPRGEAQARGLAKRLQAVENQELLAHLSLGLSQLDKNFLEELDLVVCSPLTRALQTLEIGLLPRLGNAEGRPPIVAHPFAAERLYLVSDIGKPRSVLHNDFGHFVDFDSAFALKGSVLEHWWFMLEDDRNDAVVSLGSGIDRKSYREWRPNGQGQTYSCPGEPDNHFENRMMKLYRWLESRHETTIAVVCHHGVIDWFLDEDFDNCQLRVVPFHEIIPKEQTQQKTN